MARHGRGAASGAQMAVVVWADGASGWARKPAQLPLAFAVSAYFCVVSWPPSDPT